MRFSIVPYFRRATIILRKKSEFGFANTFYKSSLLKKNVKYLISINLGFIFR